MVHQPIDAAEFLEAVIPAIRAGDAGALARAIEARWKPRQLCSLLEHPDVDLRRVAALTLGLVGDHRVVACLAGALRDDDAQVNQMAEHGLWSIWFRIGNPEAARPFRSGVARLAAENYAQASECFEEAVLIDPWFAEAHNQCAMAYFFLHQWRRSVECCRRAVEAMPVHFGAMAGMGHAHAQLGEFSRALACYRRALEINPRMPAIPRMIERLEQGEGDNDSSGIYSSSLMGR